MRKNQPLVPRSNIAGSWTRGGGGYEAGVFAECCHFFTKTVGQSKFSRFRLKRNEKKRKKVSQRLRHLCALHRTEGFDYSPTSSITSSNCAHVHCTPGGRGFRGITVCELFGHEALIRRSIDGRVTIASGPSQMSGVQHGCYFCLSIEVLANLEKEGPPSR